MDHQWMALYGHVLSRELVEQKHRPACTAQREYEIARQRAKANAPAPVAKPSLLTRLATRIAGMGKTTNRTPEVTAETG